MVNPETGTKAATMNKNRDPKCLTEKNIYKLLIFFCPVFMNKTNAGGIRSCFQVVQ